MVWYGMVWCGMVWYTMIYDILFYNGKTCNTYAASIITPTPVGLMALATAMAICFVSRSCTEIRKHFV